MQDPRVGGLVVWWFGDGGVLLSHALSGAVPSALAGLASGFGMGPGVSLSLWPPSSGSGCCSGVVRVVWGVGVGIRMVDASVCVFFLPVFSRSVFLGVREGVRVWVLAISTSQLRTLPCFHAWPIDPVVFREPLPAPRGGHENLSWRRLPA